MSKHPIDKIFEEKLKDFEQMPRAVVWDKLNAALDKKVPVSWWKRKVVWWSSGISITLLSIGLALWQPQVSPPPAQVAAKMVDLQLKLAGNPLARFDNKKTTKAQASTTQNNTLTKKNFTETKANQARQNTQKPDVTPKGHFARPKQGNTNKMTVKTGAKPRANITTAQRKSFGDYFTPLRIKSVWLSVAAPEPKSHLPKPNKQFQVTVTLKLSENMAAERAQDEGGKGLKKIWKKLKGLDHNKTKTKKAEKKRSILRFLGDRDD
ncbi:hypothetical protein [Microscilla marina]|uniref:Uncharacterized protein n=1 Tax=Microscilla marina ATCC 23134 TaxID=313606 RepID=A1ZJQ2_MICM2|nr:hypothetical protein [Microscilla marina]EAY29355.1 hypothetical protein M23134_01411 [Microscilla marina ATCC 23134]